MKQRYFRIKNNLKKKAGRNKKNVKKKFQNFYASKIRFTKQREFRKH